MTQPPDHMCTECSFKDGICHCPKVDKTAMAMGKLAKLHGIPVITNPYIKEPTLVIPMGYELNDLNLNQ